MLQKLFLKGSAWDKYILTDVTRAQMLEAEARHLRTLYSKERILTSYLKLIS